MNVYETIGARRSIRRYTDAALSEKQLLKLLHAASLAPSAKNRQPWFFYIINNQNVKRKFVDALSNGVDLLYRQYQQKKIPRPDILGAKKSLHAMEQAAALILVKLVSCYDTYYDDGVDWPLHALDIEATDLLSIGAAIQNILLAAEEMGLGSLWVCDIFYAYPALSRFLQEDAPIVSAICLGHPDEAPGHRPRRPVNEIFTILREKEE